MLYRNIDIYPHLRSFLSTEKVQVVIIGAKKEKGICNLHEYYMNNIMWMES